MTAIRMTPQITEGRAAFSDGASLSCNPYPPGTVGANDWEIGYLGAQMQARGRVTIAKINAALVRTNPWMGQT